MTLNSMPPLLTCPPAPSWLAAARRPFHDDLYAFYSSEFGGVITDPLYMRVPVDDHLVHRGDGVFETLKCANGRIYCLEEHLERLARSALAVGLANAPERDVIRHLTLSTIAAGGRRNCLIRILLARGPGSMGVAPGDCPHPALYIIVHKLPPPFMEQHPQGASVVTSDLPVKAGLFATIKSCNYLPNALLKKEAADRGADFSVNVDEEGFLAEGATENFGIVSAEGVLRIPKPGRILAGTTMLRAFELAGAGVVDGWLAGREEAPITLDDVAGATEILIFGTTTNVTAVVILDGRRVGDGRPGPVYRNLAPLLLAEQATDNPFTTQLPA